MLCTPRAPSSIPTTSRLIYARSTATSLTASYVIVALLNKDETSARMISGRYVDRLEKRNGEWKIALRRSTVDVLIAGTYL